APGSPHAPREGYSHGNVNGRAGEDCPLPLGFFPGRQPWRAGRRLPAVPVKEFGRRSFSLLPVVGFRVRLREGDFDGDRRDVALLPCAERERHLGLAGPGLFGDPHRAPEAAVTTELVEGIPPF